MILFSRVIAVKHKVYDPSLGPCHTIILTDVCIFLFFDLLIILLVATPLGALEVEYFS